MSVVDGNIDVPALAWCSANDAALWIMSKRRPVALHHLALMKEVPFFFNVEEDLTRNLDYLQSWALLYEATSQGKVKVRGRPVFGLENIMFNLTGPPLLGEKSGDIKAIPPAKIKAAGEPAFDALRISNSLCYRRIYAIEPGVRAVWAYAQVEVNFSGLKKLFHPIEGSAIRIGTKVKFIESHQPQEAPITQAAVSRNAGGRPPKWDWKGVINATWAAMFAGRLGSEQRKDLNEFMKDWFVKHTGSYPETSQITDEVKKMWDAMKAEDRKAEEAAARKADVPTARKTT